MAFTIEQQRAIAIASARARMNAAPPEPQQVKEEAPQAKPETLESKAVRFTQGALDPVIGIAQMVPRGIGAVAKGINAIVPNDYINGQMSEQLAGAQDKIAQGREQWYEQAKKNEGITGFDGMRVLGNVLSPANYVPGQIAGRLGKTATATQRIVKGAAAGGIFGATAPVTDPNASYAEQKLKQIGLGAAVGGAIPAAGEMVSRAIKPNVGAGQQKLINEGVRLTPGQILGGFYKTAEDKMTSLPIVGDMITKSRQRGIEDLNKAVGNRALEPIGKSVPDNVSAGHDLVNYVDDTLGQAYDDLLPKLTGKVDQQFTQDMQQLSGMVRQLPETMQKQFDSIIENQLTNKISPNGTITGDTVKEIEMVLGQKARGYMKSQDFDQQQLGDAIRQTQANLREWLARQNPQHAGALRKINEGWANFTRLREASGSLGAKEGVFTPAQLQNRVRAMGGKNGFAKGNNLMQDLSSAAKDVLPSQYPDSGTTGRLLFNLGAMGTGAAVSPTALGGLGVGAAAYSRPGQAALQYMLAQPKLGAASEPTANFLRKALSPSDLARFYTR